MGIEAEARAWAKAQRYEKRVTRLEAFMRRNPRVMRFIDGVMKQNRAGGEASWKALTAHLVENYGLPKETKPNTLSTYYYRVRNG